MRYPDNYIDMYGSPTRAARGNRCGSGGTGPQPMARVARPGQRIVMTWRAGDELSPVRDLALEGKPGAELQLPRVPDARDETS